MISYAYIIPPQQTPNIQYIKGKSKTQQINQNAILKFGQVNPLKENKKRKEKYGDKKTKNKMAYVGHNFSSKE